MIAVAFLKRAGAEYLQKCLSACLADGARTEIFVGTDFFLTEPDALSTLLDLAERFPHLEVFIAARSAATFHPKLYAAFSSDGVKCLTGSANLTGGGIGRNIEASLLVSSARGSALDEDIRAMFASFRDDTRFRPLDTLSLTRYRLAWKPAEKAREEFEDAISDLDRAGLDLNRLDSLYESYRSDASAQAELKERRGYRSTARDVQKAIAALADADLSSSARAAAFRGHLRDLMSGADGGRHLWPSDAIYRQGSRALKRPGPMIDLFLAAAAASKRPTAEGYGALRDLGLKIPGVGPNMITEILSTFSPGRFAVVNGNTRRALAHLGLTFPGALQLGAVTPARYAEICMMIAAVRDRIDADDFPETDAFLNWVYQKTRTD